MISTKPPKPLGRCAIGCSRTTTVTAPSPNRWHPDDHHQSPPQARHDHARSRKHGTARSRSRIPPTRPNHLLRATNRTRRTNPLGLPRRPQTKGTTPMSYAGPMPLIGIAGKKRSGKDTVAKALEPFGYQRVGFADELKQMALEINPMIPGDTRLRGVVKDFGWECAKEFPGVRKFLQELGTSIRERDRYFWIRTAFMRINPALADGYGVVVPDVRYPNEVDAIRRAGGTVIQVVRPGRPDDGDRHASETALDGIAFNHTIFNDAGLDTLKQRAIEARTDCNLPTPPREVPRWV